MDGAQGDSCQQPLTGDDTQPQRHQVVEIPPLRPVVTEYQLHQLVCPFGTHSAQGSCFVEAMMTVVATLKQQHRNPLDYLTAACEAALWDEEALPCFRQRAWHAK